MASESSTDIRNPTPDTKARTDSELLRPAHVTTESEPPADDRVDAHLAKRLAPDPTRTQARRLTLLLRCPN
jgi:hypothetical protein